MPFDLTRENIQTIRTIGSAESQALVEGSVLLPGTASGTTLLFTDGRISIGTIEVQADRVALDGSVIFTIIYTDEDEGSVNSVDATCSFNHVLDIKGAGARMNAQVIGDIESIDAELSGGRVSLRAVATLKGRVTSGEDIACISAINSTEPLETLSSTFKYQRVVGRGVGKALAREEFELPFGLTSRQALVSKPKARISSVSPQEDRVDVSGELMLDVFHSTEIEGRPIAKTSHTIPYDLSIDIPGVMPGQNTFAGVSVQDIIFEVNKNDEDNRTLRVEAVLQANAHVEELCDIELVSDAYSTTETGVALSCEDVDISLGTTNIDITDMYKGTLSLPEGSAPVGMVLCSFSRPVASEHYRDQNLTRVDGVLETTVIYMPSQQSVPQAYTEQVPFSATFDTLLPEGAWVSVTCEDADAIQITPDRIETKATIRLKGTYGETEAIKAAISAEESESPQQKRGGISIYFAREDDTLWSVSKKFLTTQESILHFNPDLAAITKGDRIILYTKNS